MDEREAAMRRAAEIGLEYLTSLGERHVGARGRRGGGTARGCPRALPDGAWTRSR